MDSARDLGLVLPLLGTLKTLPHEAQVKVAQDLLHSIPSFGAPGAAFKSIPKDTAAALAYVEIEKFVFQVARHVHDGDELEVLLPVVLRLAKETGRLSVYIQCARLFLRLAAANCAAVVGRNLLEEAKSTEDPALPHITLTENIQTAMKEHLRFLSDDIYAGGISAGDESSSVFNERPWYPHFIFFAAEILYYLHLISISRESDIRAAAGGELPVESLHSVYHHGFVEFAVDTSPVFLANIADLMKEILAFWKGLKAAEGTAGLQPIMKYTRHLMRCACYMCSRVASYSPEVGPLQAVLEELKSLALSCNTGSEEWKAAVSAVGSIAVRLPMTQAVQIATWGSRVEGVASRVLNAMAHGMRSSRTAVFDAEAVAALDALLKPLQPGREGEAAAANDNAAAMEALPAFLGLVQAAINDKHPNGLASAQAVLAHSLCRRLANVVATTVYNLVASKAAATNTSPLVLSRVKIVYVGLDLLTTLALVDAENRDANGFRKDGILAYTAESALHLREFPGNVYRGVRLLYAMATGLDLQTQRRRLGDNVPIPGNMQTLRSPNVITLILQLFSLKNPNLTHHLCWLLVVAINEPTLSPLASVALYRKHQLLRRSSSTNVASTLSSVLTSALSATTAAAGLDTSGRDLPRGTPATAAATQQQPLPTDHMRTGVPLWDPLPVECLEMAPAADANVITTLSLGSAGLFKTKHYMYIMRPSGLGSSQRSSQRSSRSASVESSPASGAGGGAGAGAGAGAGEAGGAAAASPPAMLNTSGWYSLGDVVWREDMLRQPLTEPKALLVRNKGPPYPKIITPGTGWEVVMTVKTKTGSFVGYAPVPPPGFMAVGLAWEKKGEGMPPKEAAVCIHTSAAWPWVDASGRPSALVAQQKEAVGALEEVPGVKNLYHSCGVPNTLVPGGWWGRLFGGMDARRRTMDLPQEFRDLPRSMVASMCALLRDTTTASRQALHVAATLVRRFVGLEVALPEHQEFHQLIFEAAAGSAAGGMRTHRPCLLPAPGALTEAARNLMAGEVARDLLRLMVPDSGKVGSLTTTMNGIRAVLQNFVIALRRMMSEGGGQRALDFFQRFVFTTLKNNPSDLQLAQIGLWLAFHAIKDIPALFGDFVTRNKAKEAWLVLLQVQRTFPRDPVIQYYAALGSSFLTHSQYNSKDNQALQESARLLSKGSHRIFESGGSSPAMADLLRHERTKPVTELETALARFKERLGGGSCSIM